MDFDRGSFRLRFCESVFELVEEVGGVELDRILDMFRLIIFVGCWEEFGWWVLGLVEVEVVEVGWFFSLRERSWVRDLLVMSWLISVLRFLFLFACWGKRGGKKRGHAFSN